MFAALQPLSCSYTADLHLPRPHSASSRDCQRLNSITASQDPQRIPLKQLMSLGRPTRQRGSARDATVSRKGTSIHSRSASILKPSRLFLQVSIMVLLIYATALAASLAVGHAQSSAATGAQSLRSLMVSHKLPTAQVLHSQPVQVSFHHVSRLESRVCA